MKFRNIIMSFIAVLVLSACADGYSNRGITVSPEATLNDNFEKACGSDRIYFSFNSSEISAESKAVLKKQAEWLKDNPSVKAVIEGHCDPRGTRELNLALGERRAESARKALVQMGVDASRISTISYGKERPAVIGNTEADYALNRRDVTVVGY